MGINPKKVELSQDRISKILNQMRHSGYQDGQVLYKYRDYYITADDSDNGVIIDQIYWEGFTDGREHYCIIEQPLKKFRENEPRRRS